MQSRTRIRLMLDFVAIGGAVGQGPTLRIPGGLAAGAVGALSFLKSSQKIGVRLIYLAGD